MNRGVSYGTVVGATFASLFPDRVERVLLDGKGFVNFTISKVLYLHHDTGNADLTTWWYGKSSYPERFKDVEAILEDFFNLCYIAGQSRCQLWFPTVAEIKAAFYDVDRRFASSPFPTIEGGLAPMSDWVTFVRFYVYQPLFSWMGPSGLAAVVNKAYRESVVNGTLLEKTKEFFSFDYWLEDPDTGLKNGLDSIHAIYCGDKEPFTAGSLESIWPAYEKMANASECARE